MAQSTCSIDGCEKAHRARGWCTTHYERWRKWGDPLGSAPVADAESHLLARINMHGPLRSPYLGRCWIWTASKDRDGYGRLGGKKAHRVAYTIWNGDIPCGLQIDHLCRNRDCVNPAHLEAVTPAENLRRGNTIAAKQSRQTHCKRGHPFSDENTAFTHGRRHCLTCRRLRRRN